MSEPNVDYTTKYTNTKSVCIIVYMDMQLVDKSFLKTFEEVKEKMSDNYPYQILHLTKRLQTRDLNFRLQINIICILMDILTN